MQNRRFASAHFRQSMPFTENTGSVHAVSLEVISMMHHHSIWLPKCLQNSSTSFLEILQKLWLCGFVLSATTAQEAGH